MVRAITGDTRRQRRQPMAEINVVPYVDVMLVLLVIFMVTAPLLYQGVEVELPQASTEPLPQEDSEPVIVEVDSQGRYFLNLGEDPDKPVKPRQLVVTVKAVMQRHPDKRVLVRGDKAVPYGRVVTVMAQLQSAGVPQVGLMTEPAAGNSG